MIYRFSLRLLGGLLSFFPFCLNAQGFGVPVDSALVHQNESVCIPVKSEGLADIVSFQYSLSWDPQVLKFDHSQNLILPFIGSSYYHEITPGRLLIGWNSPDGLPKSQANGTVLYEVCFQAIGPVGSSTDITPGSDGFPFGSGYAEAFNDNNTDVWTPALNVPGYVEIDVFAASSGLTDAGTKEANPFQLTPNPTASVARAVLVAETAGKGTLSVTDPLGRVVYTQKIQVIAGANSFDIPAIALNAKGMYQVSLQTERGVSTRA